MGRALRAAERAEKARRHLSRLTSDYAASTTVHGVPYLNRPDTASRAFWLAALAACLALAAGLSLEAFWQWRATPVLATVDTAALPVGEVEFPQVTLCAEGAPLDSVEMVLRRQVGPRLRHFWRMGILRMRLSN